MSKDALYTKLIAICGVQNVSNEGSLLKKFSSDLSFIEEKMPKYIIWPKKTEDVEKILNLANQENFSIIPISSSTETKHWGDTIPKKDNTVILNLSKMKKILNIDRKNRVVMIEPGVTFGDLIPILKKKGLRLLIPLCPTVSKSVLTTALEREPIIIPRYHWDSSDPLLCTEVVFGTGDLFRTGTAAGPGTIKQQQKMGQAQVNPMGPTQFSPYRVIQGAQGSLGVVTWVTLKLELIPSIQRLYHLQSNNLQKLLDVQQQLLKYRLCDELFIVNNVNFACLFKQSVQEISDELQNLDKWNLIFIFSGRGSLAKDKISYLEGDINDIITNLGYKFLKSTTSIPDNEIITILSNPTNMPWKMRLKGGYQDIFFLTNFERISEYISLVEAQFPSDLGIYVQAINQGTSYHCEFDIYYDPSDTAVVNTVKEKFSQLSTQLMDRGAFFNRPYGILTKEVYAHQSNNIINALKKVKQIFDPNNIMNPGVLCFDD